MEKNCVVARKGALKKKVEVLTLELASARAAAEELEKMNVILELEKAA